MADFKGWSRTNFFKVRKDKKTEFMRWVRSMGLGLSTRDGKRGGYEYCLHATGGDGWPGYDPASDQGDEVSGFDQQISRFLAPGSIAVMVEAGAEGTAYVGGNAVAVDHRGESVHVSLIDSIMDNAARKWPKAKISRPSYGG